jgi:Holliday junction resolvase RusA-like endonuclease
MIELIIKGVPVAKGRPRLSKWGAYTPEATKMAERNLQAQAILFKRPEKPCVAPVCVEIEFYIAIPMSDSKRVRERKLSGQELPAKKPDIDNLAKLVLDALNGVYWQDDNQIVQLSLSKQYSEEPRTVVRIKEAV